MFEVIGLGIMPALMGMSLLPAMLVANLAEALLALRLPMPAAWLVHLVAGIVIFPAGYLALRVLTGLRSWLVAGALWGIALWFLAQGILAPLAGRPFMLGFIAYTWASLAAHLAYTLAVAWTLDRRSRA